MLAGLIPPDGSDQDELRKRLMAGRYSEVRMLYYLGKDVFRWVEQCMEIAERTPELKDAEVRAQSFVGMLSGGPPESVKEKLIRWGVVDYTSIFSRCVGLNSLFAEPPQITGLTEEFLRNYHRYLDALYRCYVDLEPHRIIVAHNFRFEFTLRASTPACSNRSGKRNRKGVYQSLPRHVQQWRCVLFR